MVRLLLILTLVAYVLYKLGLFRIFINPQVGGQRRGGNFNRRPTGGNVNIDSAPNKEKKRSDFKGGEYVDYEDVK